MRRWIFGVAVTAMIAACGGSLWAVEIETLLKTIKSVGREGQGNTAAGQAVNELSQQDATVLPTVLESFTDANPLAANFLRSAVEAIADRSLKAGKSLPNSSLEKFISDKEQDPRGRRLAYELLSRVDTAAPDRLIPGMLLDPSPDFRRDAVARLIESGEKLLTDKESDAAKVIFKKALSGATDDDQVKTIAKHLKELKEEIDLKKHFGFLTEWRVIGPFDNVAFKGFDTVYPPEEKLELAATIAGQKGEVHWEKFATDHEYGIFNIAKQIAPHKGATMYAVTEFQSPAARVIELRLGTPNAWKLWLNGKLLFGRDEYHRGMAIDQYRVRGELKPGANTILLKICQNEQTDDWAQRYEFQLRIADLSGIGIASQSAPATSQK